MSKTKVIEMYRFDELEEEAKQRAKDGHAKQGYSWSNEAMDSIQALAKRFGGKMKDWSIDFFGNNHSHASFRMPCGWTAEDIEKELQSLGSFNAETYKGNGDCILTGYCMDENAIDGFRIAFMQDGVTDIDDLMQAAFDSWLKAAQADCQYQFTDEAFSEHCHANDYWFTEDGEIE